MLFSLDTTYALVFNVSFQIYIIIICANRSRRHWLTADLKEARDAQSKVRKSRTKDFDKRLWWSVLLLTMPGSEFPVASSASGTGRT